MISATDDITLKFVMSLKEIEAKNSNLLETALVIEYFTSFNVSGHFVPTYTKSTP